MSRLKYRIGDRVILEGEEYPITITRVESALDAPYFCTDNMWYVEDALSTYVEPTPTWEEVEAHIKHIVEELRDKFQENDETGLYFTIEATGRPDGDIKIKYTVSDSEYGSPKVDGYSLRPTLEELFRRKTWKSRNEPLALTHDDDGGPV